MKILYCIPSLCNSGGMERILTEKVNWLASHGYEVTVATTEQQGRAPFFELDPSVRLVNLDIDFNSHLDCNLLSKLVKHYSKLRLYRSKLEELFKHGCYDTVISMGGKEIEFLGDMEFDCRKIAELHFSQKFKEQFVHSRTSSFIHRIAAKWLTHTFIRSTQALDKLVVLTKEDEKVWRKTNTNVCQIYNFVDLPKKAICRDNSSKVCIAVGRLDEQKGFDMLIPIWETVHRKHPDWTLEIYGTGKWADMLQADIDRRGLHDHISLKGQSKDIRVRLMDSGIFLMTSRYEGFPMVLLEAEAAGLPIVSFDCPTGPKEIIEDDKNGYLIPPGDLYGFAGKVIDLIENEDRRIRFGKASLDLVKRFDKERIMAQWSKVIGSPHQRI